LHRGPIHSPGGLAVEGSEVRNIRVGVVWIGIIGFRVNRITTIGIRVIRVVHDTSAWNLSFHPTRTTAWF
jgi:hypothetical protein